MASDVTDFKPSAQTAFENVLSNEGYEYKPSEDTEAPAATATPQETKPVAAEPETEAGEEIDNFEIDVDVEEETKAPVAAAAAPEKPAVPEPTATSGAATTAIPEESKDPVFTAENLAPKITYTFSQLMEIKETINFEEYEPSKNIQYFLNRKIIRSELPAEWKNRKYNQRGGHRRPRGDTGFRRHITEEQRKILEEAKHIKERLRRPLPERQQAEKKARSILNKLTPQNFEKLKGQLFDICKESEDQTTDATHAIYVRACSGNKYTEMFAQLCAFLACQKELYFGKDYKKN
jgi:hypothetical protein